MAGKRNYHLDKIGNRYGRLTFIGMTNKVHPKGSYIGKFKCDCGNECYYLPYSVFNRNKKHPTVSCGCKRKENAKDATYIQKRKEGLHRNDTPENDNKLGYKHVYYNETDQRYHVKIVRDGVTFGSTFSTLHDALNARDAILKAYNHQANL